MEITDDKAFIARSQASGAGADDRASVARTERTLTNAAAAAAAARGPAQPQLFLHRHGASSFNPESARHDTIPTRFAGSLLKRGLTQPRGSGSYASWQIKADAFVPMSGAIGDYHLRAPSSADPLAAIMAAETAAAAAAIAAATPAGSRPCLEAVADSALNPFRFASHAVAASHGEAYAHGRFGHLSPWPAPRYDAPGRHASPRGDSKQQGQRPGTTTQHHHQKHPATTVGFQQQQQQQQEQQQLTTTPRALTAAQKKLPCIDLRSDTFVPRWPNSSPLSPRRGVGSGAPRLVVTRRA